MMKQSDGKPWILVKRNVEIIAVVEILLISSNSDQHVLAPNYEPHRYTTCEISTRNYYVMMNQHQPSTPTSAWMQAGMAIDNYDTMIVL